MAAVPHLTTASKPEPISISPLLKRLAYPDNSHVNVAATEIASAFALIFEDRLSVIQTSALLTLLHATGKDRDAEVIALCATRMREAATTAEDKSLRKVIRERGRKEGSYRGGLCDIVGTGGDSHSTFNISTTSSIIASPLLMIAKHGNRAQTSFSGSADVLTSLAPTPPRISAVKADNLCSILEQTNYTFLFAPNFHPAMMYADPVRRGLGIRTIFNLLGPLANPVEWALEARLVGVAYQSLGPVFADALRLSGAKKAMVICGEEDLDEISCAGRTNCWLLTENPNPAYKSRDGVAGSETTGEGEDEDNGDGSASDSQDEDNPKTLVKTEAFSIHPSDFGLPTHPLSEVGGGKQPRENAQKLLSILSNELPRDDPILDFVLLNVAALLVVSGVCEADTSNMGPGDDGQVIGERGPGGGRWKEGVRRARWAIESGAALRCLKEFIEITNRI